MDRRRVAAVAAVMRLLEGEAPGEAASLLPAPPVRGVPGPSPWALYGRQSIMRAGQAARARLRRARGQEGSR